MPEIIIPDYHPLYANADDITSICAPLQQHLNVTHFSFVRIYTNGERVHLSNHPELQKFFYGHFFDYIATDHLSNCVDNYVNGYITWEDMLTSQLLQDIGEYFQTANGIVLVNRAQDFVEFAFFGTTLENKQGTAYYISHIDLLEQFVHYFKGRASKLFIKAEAHRISTPLVVHSDATPIIITHLPLSERQQFLQKIQDRPAVTPRERECIEYLFQGFSSKQMAKAFDISPRTVERHIENIKKKFDCKKTTQILNKACQFGFIDAQ